MGPTGSGMITPVGLGALGEAEAGGGEASRRDSTEKLERDEIKISIIHLIRIQLE